MSDVKQRNKNSFVKSKQNKYNTFQLQGTT